MSTDPKFDFIYQRALVYIDTLRDINRLAKINQSDCKPLRQFKTELLTLIKEGLEKTDAIAS
jgi:hypothetical protein